MPRDDANPDLLQTESYSGPSGWLLLLVCFLVGSWTVIVGQLFFQASRCKAVVSDFGVELTTSQILVIQLSDWIVQYWYVALPAILLGIGALFGVCFHFEHLGWRWFPRLLLGASLTGTWIFGAWICISLAATISAVSEKLS